MKSIHDNSEVQLECARCGEVQTFDVTSITTFKTREETNSPTASSDRVFAGFMRGGGCELDPVSGKWEKVY